MTFPCRACETHAHILFYPMTFISPSPTSFCTGGNMCWSSSYCSFAEEVWNQPSSTSHRRTGNVDAVMKKSATVSALKSEAPFRYFYLLFSLSHKATTVPLNRRHLYPQQTFEERGHMYDHHLPPCSFSPRRILPFLVGGAVVGYPSLCNSNHGTVRYYYPPQRII